MTAQEIGQTFSTRLLPPEDSVVQKLTLISEGYQNLAHMVNAQLNDGREKSLAMTKLQESFLFATNSVG